MLLPSRRTKRRYRHQDLRPEAVCWWNHRSRCQAFRHHRCQWRLQGRVGTHLVQRCNRHWQALEVHRKRHRRRCRHSLGPFQCRSHPSTLKCWFQHRSTSHRRRRHRPMHRRWNRHRGLKSLRLHQAGRSRKLFRLHQ